MTRPPQERSAAGRAAEDAVCVYLGKRGMQILERNFRARGGEIDVIARDGDVLAFVEVRFREEDGHGHPEETVGPAKRKRIVKAARTYLATIPPHAWKTARFDVAAVEGGGRGGSIRYYPGAFDAEGKIL